MKPGSSLSAIGFSISDLNERLVSGERSGFIHSIKKINLINSLYVYIYKSAT